MAWEITAAKPHRFEMRAHGVAGHVHFLLLDVVVDLVAGAPELTSVWVGTHEALAVRTIAAIDGWIAEQHDIGHFAFEHRRIFVALGATELAAKGTWSCETV